MGSPFGGYAESLDELVAAREVQVMTALRSCGDVLHCVCRCGLFCLLFAILVHRHCTFCRIAGPWKALVVAGVTSGV